MIRLAGLALIALVLAAPAFAAPPERPSERPFEYRGPCDASAAVALGADHFIVANDEDNALRVYRRGNPHALTVLAVDDFAKADPDHPEMDLEGAARIGARVYWITSHGANKNGKDRPGRRRLFATDIALQNGRGVITPVGRAYDGLVDDLAAAKALQKYDLASAARIAPKDAGGFNIEGLAATRKGTLLLGLRNPLPGARALVIEVLNPEAIIRDARAKIGAVHELDLGGLGIRSMEAAPGGYLIVAGSPDGADRFRLYRWPGGSAAAVSLGVDFGALKPEALYRAGGRIHILSDDGTRDINGVACKSAVNSDQRFRALTLAP